MEEEIIKVVKAWPKPQLVKDIQVFLGFANFYRRFIRNFSRIAAPFTLILQTTDDETFSIQAIENRKNQDEPSSIAGTSSSSVGRNIKNLSTIAKWTKSKRSDLPKAQFAKINFGTDFLTLKAKKTFIHLWKAFTEALILGHFDPECHI